MVISEIIAKKRRDLEELKRRFPLHRLREAAEVKKKDRENLFKKAISRKKEFNLICELKKASPSEGVIREDFQPLRLAQAFEHAGACAISVLTETHYFKGRPSYLKTVRQATHLPLLRKDFLFETYQIYETALLEADAFLLISSALTDKELKELISLGKEFGMEALVETHTEEDLKKAINAGAEIIGINNRDLKTLSVDVSRAKGLLRHIPKGSVPIVESGIKTHNDLMEYKSLGVNTFLVGSIIMKSENVVEKIQSLLGINKKWKTESDA